MRVLVLRQCIDSMRPCQLAPSFHKHKSFGSAVQYPWMWILRQGPSFEDCGASWTWVEELTELWCQRSSMMAGRMVDRRTSAVRPLPDRRTRTRCPVSGRGGVSLACFRHALKSEVAAAVRNEATHLPNLAWRPTALG